MTDAAVRPIPGPPRPYHFPDHTRTVLANGLTVLVAPVRRLPICALSVVVDAGAELDAPGEEGCALLTARAVAEGTRDFQGIEFTERLEGIGASLEASADWDGAHMSLAVGSERLQAALELLGAAVMQPAFPEMELLRLREERLSEIVQIRSEPRGLANENFSGVIYTPDSRYAIPLGGSDASVSALGRPAIVRHHAALYTPARTAVIVAGDVSTTAVQDMVEQVFGAWQVAESRVAPRRGSESQRRARVTVVHRDGAPQSEIRVGHVGVHRTHEDYFPLVLLNAILGGLFSSRINLNLREEHAYTYGAHSGFDWRRGAGPFMIHTAVESGVTAAAVGEILAELERIRKEPVTESEMSLARDYLAGVFPIRFETSLAITAALAQMVVYELPADYYDSYRERIAAVGVSDVQRVAQQHLDPGRTAVVTVGDATATRDQLEALGIGPVEVTPAQPPSTAALSAVPTPG